MGHLVWGIMWYMEATPFRKPADYGSNHGEPYLEPQSEINPYLNPRHVQRINISVLETTPINVKNRANNTTWKTFVVV